jgi:hypothetical protein
MFAPRGRDALGHLPCARVATDVVLWIHSAAIALSGVRTVRRRLRDAHAIGRLTHRVRLRTRVLR